MSDSEEENFCFFGKPLEPYDEDSFPKKKPIAVEDQVATDAQGRRRFHGAFTGGFSAGFFNTVGSLEGWKPSEFKSTRQEKAANRLQRPEDFMDDEDIGEHGIAPQTVRATNEFSTSKKRRRQAFSDGPIPGEPVLHTLLTSGNETIGYLLLKNIGIQEKIDVRDEEINTETEAKVYGCQMPRPAEIPKSIKAKQYEIPSIYKEFLQAPKANTFGLGYEGLDKSHINLFQSTNLVVKERNNKKLSIAGQAFGVGAFEDEDEDIYVKDDMSKYDFELTSEKKLNKSKQPAGVKLVFEMFIHSKTPLLNKKLYTAPTIPHSFTGKHKIRKSRFEPIKQEVEESSPVTRKEINPIIRAQYLGEETNKTFTASKNIKSETRAVVEPAPSSSSSSTKDKTTGKKDHWSTNLVLDRFVSSSQPEDVSNILEPVTRSETTHGTQDMREAARMKMFGPLTRITEEWHPSSLLCKRFNIPEPLLDKSDSNRYKKRTKNLIFQYQKHEDDLGELKPGLTMQKTEDVANEAVESEQSQSTAEVTPNALTTNTEETSAPTNKEEETIPVDITDKVDVEKNVDLFKAVFLSSSESEDEDEPVEQQQIKQEEEEKQEELKSTVLSDTLLPKIKPLKEGILSNVSFEFRKPETAVDVVNNQNSGSSSNVDPLSFGPMLPQSLGVTNNKVVEVSSDDGDDDNEWIEKDKKSKKKNKHKKKHKKDKHGKKDKHSKKRK